MPNTNKIQGLIKRNFWFCDESVKLTLYKTIVRRKLEFTTSVWDPHYKCDILRIEGVQRAAARFCKSDYRYTSSIGIMVDSLGLEPLETRRKVGRLSIMYTIIEGFVDLNMHNYLQSSKKTRTRNSHASNSRPPFSSKNAPFFQGPQDSGISSHSRHCCLHRSLCSRRK